MPMTTTEKIIRTGRATRASGLWFLSEPNIRQLLGRMAQAAQRGGMEPAQLAAMSAIGSRVDDDGDGDQGIQPVSYSTVDGMAIIPVVGILTKYPMPEAWMDEYCGTVPALAVQAALDRAMNDWMVDGVTLVIDSPGGMVAGTNQLAEAIAGYKTSHPDKPIYAAVSDLAASGGYYIASQCRSIACNQMGEVGCIGVYCVMVDDSAFWNDMGVKFTVVSSGGVKGLGADGVVSQELIDDQKRNVMAMYEKFIADVSAGRGLSLEQARQLGDGRCWIAPEAKKLGLIDTVSSVEAAVTAATQETQRMNAEAFNAYAAEHPEATERFVKQGFDKAKAEFNRPATVQELEALMPGRSDFVLAQLKANATRDSASVAAGAIFAAEKIAADKKSAEDLKAVIDAKDAEIAKITKERDQALFAAGGQKPLGTATGAVEREKEAKGPPVALEEPDDDAPEEDKKAWAKATAEAEWEANAKDCKKRFSSRDRYVAYRSAELTGRHRTLSKA